MNDKEELCRHIKYILPDIGACGIDIEVDWDEKNDKWLITLCKGEKRITTFIDKQDADICTQDKACAGLLAEVAQFKADADAQSE